MFVFKEWERKETKENGGIRFLIFELIFEEKKKNKDEKRVKRFIYLFIVSLRSIQK